jgi:hypothetical protein
VVDSPFLDGFGYPPPLSLHDAGNDEDSACVPWGLNPTLQEGVDDLAAALWWGCPDSDAPSNLGMGLRILEGQV